MSYQLLELGRAGSYSELGALKDTGGEEVADERHSCSIAQPCLTLGDPMACNSTRTLAEAFPESQRSSLQTEMSDRGALWPGASRATSGRLRTLSIRLLSCKSGVITPSLPAPPPPHTQDVI